MIKRLSDEMYETPEKAIEELIQNGVDACATKIDIEINDEKIVYNDDGIGFNHERRTAFCTQGTDYKVKHPKTKKGKMQMGNKGIGRYAIFKLAGTCEVRTKSAEHSKELASYWIMDNSNFIVGEKLSIKDIKWTKFVDTGSEFLMYNLTKEGFILKKRVADLKKRIAMNFNVSDCNVYINGEKIEEENVKYESGFSEKIDHSIDGIYMNGEIGLMTKEAEITGVTIKVNARGVGDPLFFDLDKEPRYNMYLSRLRGVLNVDALNDSINANRSGFKPTDDNFIVVKRVIINTIKKVLDKKIKQQEKYKKSKLSKLLHDYFKSLTPLFNKIFEHYKGAFKTKNLEGKAEGDEEVGELKEGNERIIEHSKGRKPKQKTSLDGTIGIDNDKKGKLKIGKYNWFLVSDSKGTEEKLVVIDINGRRAIINEDHPAFKMYVPYNLNFLTLEIIYAVSLTIKEYSNEELRNVVDTCLREIPKRK